MTKLEREINELKDTLQLKKDYRLECMTIGSNEKTLIASIDLDIINIKNNIVIYETILKSETEC